MLYTHIITHNHYVITCYCTMILYYRLRSPAAWGAPPCPEDLFRDLTIISPTINSEKNLATNHNFPNYNIARGVHFKVVLKFKGLFESIVCEIVVESPCEGCEPRGVRAVVRRGQPPRLPHNHNHVNNNDNNNDKHTNSNNTTSYYYYYYYYYY